MELNNIFNEIHNERARFNMKCSKKKIDDDLN